MTITFKIIYMKNIKNKALVEQIVIVSYMLESIAHKTVLEPLGLTMTGYKILHILNENGSMAISEIITCLGASKSNISQRLDYLEKNGFVERTAVVGGDKRQVMIVITSKGGEKFGDAKNILKKEWIKLEEIFTAKEIGEMSGFMNKMFEKLISNIK